jgi:RecA-family ATPase
MASTPYSYVTTGGVQNTRVRVADATLDELAEFETVQLDVASIEYHNADKKTKGSIKKQLPYFVGGVVEGKRDDANVQSRTLLTLDIERSPKQDSEPPLPVDVVRKLRELDAEGWVYTSLSHTPKSPRYRVVLPLGKPLNVEDMAEAQAVLKASTLNAAAKLGIEEWCTPESYVLSQAMYLPAALRGSKVYSVKTQGRAWGLRAAATPKAPADIPDERPDFVLQAIRAAGLYIEPNPKHKGMHFIRCPQMDEHEAENDTQTVYYEAHFDGNPRPAVKCFDSAPDHDGHPHLTFRSLVRWLKDSGHLTQDQQTDAGVLDDYDTFDAKSTLQRVLSERPTEREWAVERFAPVGKVTVLAGPGGVSKSMLLLHMLIYASTGCGWGGFEVGAPLRSLYVSYEDDAQEMHKRVYALADALRSEDSGTFDVLFDVAGSIQKNIRMFAADDEAAAWLLLTKPERFGPPERTERVDWLVGYIKERGIKLLALDPAVYTHQLEENSVADMALYMQTLTYIAKQAKCAVVVLHHMHKTAGWSLIDDINQGSLRGASSFADNARSVAVLVSMPIKDAEGWGLPPEQATTARYAVLKHVKHNYSQPMDVMVFERDGPRLLPRPDIRKMDRAQLSEARDRVKTEDEQARTLQWLARVLGTLKEHGDAMTQNQIALECKTKPATVKKVLEHAEANDWVDVEEGPNRSKLVSLTTLGRSYVRTLQRQERA